MQSQTIIGADIVIILRNWECDEHIHIHRLNLSQIMSSFCESVLTIFLFVLKFFYTCCHMNISLKVLNPVRSSAPHSRVILLKE